MARGRQGRSSSVGTHAVEDVLSSHEFPRDSAKFSDHDLNGQHTTPQEVDVLCLAYASLPATPILPSPPASPPPMDRRTLQEPLMTQMHDPPFSLWDYLCEELLPETDFDPHQELKWERVSNFLSIPYATEKVRYFQITPSTLLTCADSCLWIYPVLGLVSLHIYYPSDSIRSCCIPFVL